MMTTRTVITARTATTVTKEEKPVAVEKEEKKASWRMSEEVKETLTKEVFNKVAHGSDAVGIEAIKEVVTQSGMEEKVIDDV